MHGACAQIAWAMFKRHTLVWLLPLLLLLFMWVWAARASHRPTGYMLQQSTCVYCVTQMCG